MALPTIGWTPDLHIWDAGYVGLADVTGEPSEHNAIASRWRTLVHWSLHQHVLGTAGFGLDVAWA